MTNTKHHEVMDSLAQCGLCAVTESVSVRVRYEVPRFWGTGPPSGWVEGRLSVSFLGLFSDARDHKQALYYVLTTELQ